MIDFEKLKRLDAQIKKSKDKLSKETDYKKRERLKLKIKIDELKVKLERLN